MNTPNKLTLARVLLVPVFVLFFYWEIPAHNFIAMWIFVAASVTDAIDGRLARKNHQITDFGKFLDPLADKILVVGAMACLVHRQKVSIIVFLLILAREFMVSALRLVVAEKGTVVPAGFAGKLKTAFTMTALVAGMLFWSLREDFGLFGAGYESLCSGMEIVLSVLFWIAAALTVWSGTEYLMHFWKDINPYK